MGNEHTIPTAELALLIGMVVAFVAAYLAVSHFEHEEPAAPAPAGPAPAGPALPPGEAG